MSAGRGKDADFAGPLTFARFAYPPNELGYCGPDEHAELLERVSAHAVGRRLRALARDFEGAWPYLQLIAGCNGVADPLDLRVVEAYWIGNSLLEQVAPAVFADALATRFGAQLRASRERDRLLDPLVLGAVPHHGFHVFGVYPWVGLLRHGAVDTALLVLDRCRVRWGRLVAIDGDRAVVRSRPLVWDGHALRLASARDELVRVGERGYRLAPQLRVGEWCALHWDWVCQPLDLAQLTALRYYTRRQVDAVNGAPFPAPAAVLA